MKKLMFVLLATFSVSAVAGGKLDKIFHYDNINTTVQYFEKTHGLIPKTIWEGTREYKVGKCEVTAYTSNGNVDSLGLKVSPSCSFNVSKMIQVLPNKQANQLTFGDVSSSMSGKYLADCLYMCGNAADPSVYFQAEGPHADNFMQVRVEGVAVRNDIIDASSKWSDIMEKKEGEDWVMETKFNCTDKYDDVADKLFRKIKITGIRIGYNFDTIGCEQ